MAVTWTNDMLEEYYERRRTPSWPLRRDIEWLESLGLYNRSTNTTQEKASA